MDFTWQPCEIHYQMGMYVSRYVCQCTCTYQCMYICMYVSGSLLPCFMYLTRVLIISKSYIFVKMAWKFSWTVRNMIILLDTEKDTILLLVDLFFQERFWFRTLELWHWLDFHCFSLKCRLASSQALGQSPLGHWIRSLRVRQNRYTYICTHTCTRTRMGIAYL